MAAAESITYALLSGVAGGRVYPVIRPQAGTLPAVVTTLIGSYPDGVIDQSAGPNLYRARVQADCFASTYAALKTVVDEVRAAVHLKSGTYAGFVVVSSVMDNVSVDDVDLDTGIYSQAVDFLITFYD
jgi:hypothetical protein